jgi:glutaredoxin
VSQVQDKEKHEKEERRNQIKAMGGKQQTPHVSFWRVDSVITWTLALHENHM